jgi:hypothetical protein
MNAYTNLPRAVQIAIPVVLTLILGFLFWSMALKPPVPVEVIKTRDVDLYESALTVLEANGIDYHESTQGADFIVAVAPGEDATAAATALAASGIKDRTGMAKEIDCPAPPGFTGTKAANERSTNCEESKAIQAMLLTAGATAANVKVSQQENGTLLGPEKSMNVVAQVFLPSHMQDSWNAQEAAEAISAAVGTSIDRVKITDGQLQLLFKSGAGEGGSDAAATTGLGCNDIAGATEVETKRAAVRNCYEQTIGAKLTELLGGSDRFVLTVEPTIDSNAVQTTEVINTPGPPVSTSERSGQGTDSSDVTSPANKKERTTVNPAGDIKSLRISVILDRDSVTEDQRIAVSSLLSSQIDAKRGDPAPVVKLSRFAGGAGSESADEELEQILAQAKADAKERTSPQVFGTRSETPKLMIAAMVVLVLVTAGAVVLLWRRSAAMNAKQQELQAAFSEEQRLFENFAQQNPDALVNDLNALFGAPSAPQRTTTP